MDWESLLKHLVSAVVFAAVGVLVFAVALKAIVHISPFSVVKEISEDQNTALAILMGAVFIGLGIIVGAACVGG